MYRKIFLKSIIFYPDARLTETQIVKRSRNLVGMPKTFVAGRSMNLLLSQIPERIHNATPFITNQICQQ